MIVNKTDHIFWEEDFERNKMSLQNVDTNISSNINGNTGCSLELTSPVDDVLFLMPEEENNMRLKEQKETQLLLDESSQKSNEASKLGKQESTELVSEDDDENNSDDDDDDDGNKITINSIPDLNKKNQNYMNQFQISIHACNEEDLELNYDSLNNNNNNNTSIANSSTDGNNDKLSLSKNSDNINRSNVELHDKSHDNETNNLSSSNGSINESGDMLKLEPCDDTAKPTNHVPKAKFGIEDTISNDMKYLFKNTRYFLIKSNNYENVNLAKAKVIN